MAENERKKGARLFTAAVFLILMGVTGVYLYLSAENWRDRIGFILKLQAFYGIGLGFMTRSSVLKDFGGLVQDMTSAHPVEFVSGNMHFLGIFFNTASIGLHSKREPGAQMALGCLGALVLMIVTPLLILYAFFHILVIVPVAYVGYLIVNALVETVVSASGDIEIISKSENEEQKIRVKQIVSENVVAAKSFLLGIPAAMLAIISELIGIFD